MTPTATHLTYLHLCPRKLWLVLHGIQMENNANNHHVEVGKLISETTYTRRPRKWRELALDGIKIDHFDPVTNTVREVKKSPKLEYVHVAQVQYYLYRLEEVGVENPKGLIEYPKQRRTREVVLDEAARRSIRQSLKEIKRIANQEECPDLVKKGYCRNCAFYDFCFV